MQRQKTAPPDLQIKDKFLVQTTVVPLGTADEDIVRAFVSTQQFMLWLLQFFSASLTLLFYFG
jgi:hypothetical protein